MSDEVTNFTKFYTSLVWKSLFEISLTTLEDPIKAYMKLESLIPLLPNKIIDEVDPLITEFKKKLVKKRKELKEQYSDSLSTHFLFIKYARKEINEFVLKVLELISRRMEELGLMYQVEKLYEG